MEYDCFFLSFGGVNMPDIIYCLVILFVILTPPPLLWLQLKSYTRVATLCFSRTCVDWFGFCTSMTQNHPVACRMCQHFKRTVSDRWSKELVKEIQYLGQS